MDAIELTKKLMAIPSYVDKEHDEVEISTFLFNYFKKLRKFEVIKQKVSRRRFNLIIKDKYPTKTIFCGHLDTVQPKAGWKTDPLKSVIKNNAIFGLGASDMKGNLAALISAFSKVEKSRGLMLLLYVDEEYDMSGMKKFILEYRNKLKPATIISADGKGFCLGNGCRGLIEITFIVQGKTGHASLPLSGINAITSAQKVVEKLGNLLKERYSDPFLGQSTCNLAFLHGGLNLGISLDGEIKFGREGNNIPDIAEFVLDIRPASVKLDSREVISLVKKLIKEQRLKLIDYKVRHDHRSWITPIKKLNLIENSIKSLMPIKYLDPSDYGYIDTQMAWEVFNKPVCLTFGAGPDMAHKPNEFIKIEDILLLENLFKLLMQTFTKGGDKKSDR